MFQEYRLVPVEYTEIDKPEDDEIDLVQIVERIWSNKYKVLKFIAVFTVLGVIYALLSPEEFEVRSVLIIENQRNESVPSMLSQYGGLIGIDPSSLTSGSSIDASLYPDVIRSLPFQLELIEQPIYFSRYDTSVTLLNFFTEVKKTSILEFVSKYTIRLPWTIRELLFSSDADPISVESNEETDVTGLITISERQKNLIGLLESRIQLETSSNGRTVEIVSIMPDRYAAARTVEVTTELLKRYISEYRTEKAQSNLQFVQNQYEIARENFLIIQRELAAFRDANRNLATAQAQNELQQLEYEYELTFNLYNSLAQQLEEAKIRVQEDTPIFSVLEPPTIPLNKTYPRRTLITLIAIFLGAIAGVIYTFISQNSKS